MSAEPDLPPGQRSLLDAPQAAPARQDRRRDLEEDRPDKTYYDDVIEIPGYGRKPERCQPYSPVGFCVERGHAVLGQSSCGVRYCPDHWRDWLEDAVVSGVARLAAFRHAAEEGAAKRMLHVVASPEQDRRWTSEEFWKVRSEAYDALEAVGARGGRLYAHPYRTSDRADALFETATEAGDWEEDRGKWSFLRDMTEDWEELQGMIEAAPHYHALVPCEDFDPESVPEGWVVKNIRSLDRFDYRDVESYRDMAATAWYLGTHSAVQSGRATTTWFGELHPAAFDPKEVLGGERWAEIQEKAEKAVNTKPGGVPVESGVEAMECPREGCESPVEPVRHLAAYMDNEDWVESIMPEQRAVLRGLLLWYRDQDRPPPDRWGDEEALIRWCKHRSGQLLQARGPQDQPRQSGL